MFNDDFIDRLGQRLWYQLRCFSHVVNFKSYAKAANYLHLSPSSLTKAIKALEEGLNRPLVYRGGKRALRLTPQGDQLHARCAKLFKVLLDLEQYFYPPVEALDFKLRLNVPEWVVCDYLIEPLMRFKAQHPSLSLFFGSEKEADHLSVQSDLLIGIGIPPSPGWIQKPLLQWQSALYASPAYIKGAVLPRCVDELRDHACLCWKSNNLKLFEAINWHLAQGLRADLKFDSSTALIKMTQMGCGIMAWIKDHPALKDSGLIEIAKDLSSQYAPRFSLYFVCVPERWVQPEVQALYQCLEQSLKGL
jgi:DNA-binding transcriptional LysR family regulator